MESKRQGLPILSTLLREHRKRGGVTKRAKVATKMERENPYIRIVENSGFSMSRVAVDEYQVAGQAQHVRSYSRNSSKGLSGLRLSR